MRKPNKLDLPEEVRIFLESLIKSRTQQAQIVQRARILLLKHAGFTLAAIADKLYLNIKSVILCLKKYEHGCIDHALHDAPGRGCTPEFTDEEKT